MSPYKALQKEPNGQEKTIYIIPTSLTEPDKYEILTPFKGMNDLASELYKSNVRIKGYENCPDEVIRIIKQSLITPLKKRVAWRRRAKTAAKTGAIIVGVLAGIDLITPDPLPFIDDIILIGGAVGGYLGAKKVMGVYEQSLELYKNVLENKIDNMKIEQEPTLAEVIDSAIAKKRTGEAVINGDDDCLARAVINMDYIKGLVKDGELKKDDLINFANALADRYGFSEMKKHEKILTVYKNAYLDTDNPDTKVKYQKKIDATETRIAKLRAKMIARTGIDSELFDSYHEFFREAERAIGEAKYDGSFELPVLAGRPDLEPLSRREIASARKRMPQKTRV